MAGGEHVEPQPVQPEATRARHQPERFPEIDAALGEGAGVIGDPRLQPRQQPGMDEDPGRATQVFVEPQLEEQPLQSGHMIHMGMRDEYSRRQRVIGIEVAVERVRPAIDQQQRYAGTFQHHG